MICSTFLKTVTAFKETLTDTNPLISEGKTSLQSNSFVCLDTFRDKFSQKFLMVKSEVKFSKKNIFSHSLYKHTDSVINGFIMNFTDTFIEVATHFNLKEFSESFTKKFVNSKFTGNLVIAKLLKPELEKFSNVFTDAFIHASGSVNNFDMIFTELFLDALADLYNKSRIIRSADIFNKAFLYAFKMSGFQEAIKNKVMNRCHNEPSKSNSSTGGHEKLLLLK